MKLLKPSAAAVAAALAAAVLPAAVVPPDPPVAVEHAPAPTRAQVLAAQAAITRDPARLSDLAELYCVWGDRGQLDEPGSTALVNVSARHRHRSGHAMAQRRDAILLECEPIAEALTCTPPIAPDRAAVLGRFLDRVDAGLANDQHWRAFRLFLERPSLRAVAEEMGEKEGTVRMWFSRHIRPLATQAADAELEA